MDKKDEAKDKPKAPDPIFGIIGDFGRYQFFLCMMVFLSKFGTGWHTLAMLFLQAPMAHTCVSPAGVNDSCDDKCEKVEYDHSVFESSIVSEWGLICKWSFLSELTQSLVMFGVMVGSMFFGVWSDKYGRRPAFLSCCFLQLIVSLLMPLSTWIWLHCILRFLVGFATGGTMTTSFVIIMEYVGPKHREILTILYQLPFNIGHATLPAFSYFLRNWKWYYLALGLCHIPMYIPYLCVIPESARWLFTAGRVEESSKILENVMKHNKKPTENIQATLQEAYKKKQAAAGSAEVKKGSTADLFRYPNLRKNTLAMAFNWLTVCLNYYGSSQYLSHISGDIFLNVLIGASLGLPGTIFCVFLTKYVGRKYTLVGSNTLSAVCFLFICVVNVSEWTLVIVASIGLFGASITFPNVYLFSGELFPTVVRNSAIGFCSLFGRIGSIAAPVFVKLAVVNKIIPPLSFGGLSVIAALLAFLLPETKGTSMPDTIEDGENFGKKEKKEKE